VDLRQLNALIAVAETGSVTRAAEILHLVQPAVSRQIRLLEDELEAPLFERTKQGMVLTADGRVLLEYARRAMRELERARAEIRPASAALRGLVTIGLLPSVADPLAEAVVARVSAEHPAVRLRILVAYAGHLSEWLDSTEIDMALLYAVRPTATVEVRRLVEEPVWAVGPSDAGLSAEQPIDVAKFLERPLILPSPPHALRSMVDRAAAKAGCEPRIVAETNSMTVQRRLVEAGAGYTVLPITAVSDQVAAGVLSAAPLPGEELRRRLVLAVPSTRRLGPAVRVVADLLADEVAAMVSSEAWPLATWVGELTGSGPAETTAWGRTADPRGARRRDLRIGAQEHR
jgi:LysR family nitrogen assimilation transcriptional regulator